MGDPETKSEELKKEEEEIEPKSNGIDAEKHDDSKESGEEKSSDQTSSDYYWNSYAHFGIHEEMLKDEVRTRSYMRAITHNKHLIEGKIVLDVGCGTGIMSLFAASTGAKHVYAVDACSIAVQAKQIVKDNGFEDKITVIQSKVEDLVLPVEKVDVIISEWMGYFLVYESMLDTVIYARDKWLKEGGALLPDEASLLICAIEDEEYKESKIHWWDNVWGYNMKAIKKVAMEEPLVDVVEDTARITDVAELMTFDIQKIKKEELVFTRPFTLKCHRNDRVHAFVCYFDIWFRACHKQIYFSTGPHAKYTHWKQTVFYLKDVLLVSDGDEITGELHCEPNKKNPRDMDIWISYEHKGQYGVVKNKQQYYLR